MKSIIITTLLAAAAMAAPEVKTTTKDVTSTPPICTFDPVKGEYVCPEATDPWGVIGDHLHSLRRADVPFTAEFATSTAEVKTTEANTISEGLSLIHI